MACAAWALDGAEVVLLDGSVTWEGLTPEDADEEVVLVLHDALCPATPPVFVADCVQAARESGAVVAGALPVTDTVKQLDGEFVGATVDRESLAQVTSPVVIPQASFGAAAALWPGGPESVPTDAADVVARLSTRVTVHLADAPATSRRVQGPEDLELLEATTLPG